MICCHAGCQYDQERGLWVAKCSSCTIEHISPGAPTVVSDPQHPADALFWQWFKEHAGSEWKFDTADAGPALETPEEFCQRLLNWMTATTKSILFGAAVKTEREACAKVADERANYLTDRANPRTTAKYIACTIRARSG